MRIGEVWGKMKMNESGRKKLGRYRSAVSRRGMHRYIPTKNRLRKMEPLIALGSHTRDVLNFCVRGTPRRVEKTNQSAMGRKTAIVINPIVQLIPPAY